MDVSPNNRLYVVGGKDGALRVGNVRTNAADDIRLLKGHVGDVLSCRFVSSERTTPGLCAELKARLSFPLVPVFGSRSFYLLRLVSADLLGTRWQQSSHIKRPRSCRYRLCDNWAGAAGSNNEQ